MSEPEQKDEQSCGASIEQHIIDIFGGMAVVGLGMGCREVYRALLEMGEEIRSQNNFDVYIPKGEGYAGRVIKIAIDKAQQAVKLRRQQQEALLQNSSTLVADDNGDQFQFPVDLKKN